MKIVTIEPTPSPNSMKIIVDEELPMGTSHNYKKEDAQTAPHPVSEILGIKGVKGIYHVMNFMAIERIGNVVWEDILSEVQRVFNEEDVEADITEQASDEHYGEVYVHVQTYKDIPLQVKVFDSNSELRFGLSERFKNAMEKVHSAEVENYILLRKWADYGIRYGEKQKIGETVVLEVEAAYPEERLQEIIQQSTNSEENRVNERQKVTLEQFNVDQWEKRFQLIDQMSDPDITDLPLLEQALEDEKMSIRRLATVYLGMIEDEAVIPYVEKALKDKSWAVRRTAGDCMSDLGFVGFENAAIELLKDKNKLVRWRAAMFLYETGTEKSLPALHAAEDDPEFEVKLQVRMAIARIEEGEEAKGSIWKQMTELRESSVE
ncbi:conserved virulence factor C family protein [Sporosarcina highlanderae]|uniref:Conserved virulence factor C family protein n=1 Tax=Sporosarcina highlanderae TaxID=3035916 RepID=A0ABT8JR61_9BACL|nr:conserved virulence factor C family protein [Sporosarcina highlanderae]MDN4607655.1 conserved virulence factor C family protein [Sporosarcina highlanderae]